MRLILISLSLLLSACTMVAPNYEPSIQNIQTLKRSGLESVKVDNFSEAKGANKISMRGSSMISPFEKSYGKYLAHAIETELKQAKLLSEDSNIVITGEILENDIDVSGFSEGVGNITVAFLVTNGPKKVYEKKLSTEHKFESSFMGAIAIPNGQLAYPEMVKNLLGKLFNDEDFINAIKS